MESRDDMPAEVAATTQQSQVFRHILKMTKVKNILPHVFRIKENSHICPCFLPYEILL